MHQLPGLFAGADSGNLNVFVGKQLEDTAAFGGVVIDHQQLFGARLGEFLDAAERGLQTLGRDRLVQVGEGATFQSVLALFFHGYDLHRNMSGGRVLFEMA